MQRVPRAAPVPVSTSSLPPLPPQASPAAGAERAGTLEESERELIRQVLASVNGNISEASKRLGVSRNTIYRKLRRDEPDAG